MVLTTLVLLSMVVFVCLAGVAIIPRFDRRAPLAQQRPVTALATRASPPRSA